MKIETTFIDLYKNGKLKEVIFYKTKNFDIAEKKLIIFVNDAQFAFDENRTIDKKSLGFHEITEQLNLDNCLVIGISSFKDFKDRFIEYGPYNFSRNMTVYYGLETESNKGEKYIDALINVFIPWMEEKFSIRWDDVKKIMFGVSMGGVITTYTALKYPTLFNGYIAMSNSFWVHKPYFFEEIKKFDNIGLYYHDMGSRDVTNYKDKVVGNHTEYMEGFEQMNLFIHSLQARSKSKFVEGDTHDLKSWKNRIPDALQWMIKEIKL